MKRFRLFISVTMTMAMAVISLPVSPAAAEPIVVPGDLAGIEGSGNNAFPFSPATGSSVRYQQVYAASEFAGLVGPALITQIAFRPDAVAGSAATGVFPNIQIGLSTTTRPPDGLSATFADNMGLNATIVHAGPLTLTSAFTGPAGGPKAFDMIINLTTPFLFEPALGNLLLDVHNFNMGPFHAAPPDAQFTQGDAISRVFAEYLGDAPLSGRLDTLGLITQFTIGPVIPEPASVILLASGLAGLGLWRRHSMQA